MRAVFVAITVFALSCGSAASSPSPATTTSAAPSRSAEHPLWQEATGPTGAPATTRWITVKASDGFPLVAALFAPPKGGPAPIALYIAHNADAGGIYGLLMRDLDFAASLAKEGFITVVPCWRIATASTPDICGKSSPERLANQAVQDIAAFAKAARTLPNARVDRVVAIGRSAGGSIALLAGSMNGGVDAVVSISGAFGGPGSALEQQWGTTPGAHVSDLAVPALIVHGTADSWGPGTRIEAARAYVKAAQDKGKSVQAIYVDDADDMLAFTPAYWTSDVVAKVVAFATK